MAVQILSQLRQAVSNLNPNEVRETAEKPLSIGLAAGSEECYRAMWRFLSPPDTSRERRLEQAQFIHRVTGDRAPGGHDLEIYEEGLARPPNAFVFHAARPERTVREILAKREDLGLALARAFPPFRKQVVEKVISSVSRENALFSLATALPNIMPGVLALPWAIGEFGSDTVFLTVNQIRMLFLLGAASDRPVGYREQRGEIGSIIAGAFGWRTLARELVGKVPLGGGLIPKAAIAFAGTYVVGRSAERLYRIGYGYTRDERREAYEEAFERGKEVAGRLLEGLKDLRRDRARSRG